ncbi:hypothetical protein [Chitinivorax sp. B]|uniref:hypothetical protein n=1 Tax=Chitinivorax sp. B TaxID=2502235 RepID=UPI0010F4A27B|nr:hypothetical protein [Chitinivorax sp. B]
MRPICFTLGASLLLCGCSAMPTHSTNDQSRYTYQVDHEKIELIENYAKRRTMSVHWINYPTRKVQIIQ